MSLDKAIQHHKEHRKHYYGSKAFDRTCCNHGTCEVCHENRLFSSTKRLMSANDKLKDEHLETKKNENNI